jgi:MFS family permease
VTPADERGRRDSGKREGLPTFRSFKNRNYRLYATGQIVSNTGKWMQVMAEVWLVLELTGSGGAVGLVTGLRHAPLLLFGVWGGVVVDRFDKRVILAWTQIGMALTALGLGIVTVTGNATFPVICLLAVLSGCFSAVDTPARRSFVVEMVPPADVSNAISLNSAIMTTAKIVGPAVGGLVIAAAGVAACFFSNAFSYLFFLAALALMHRDGSRAHTPTPRKRGQIREGLRYAWSNAGVRGPLLVVAVLSTIAWNFNALVPLLATQAFSTGPEGLGLLMACFAGGALIGALVTATKMSVSAQYLVAAIGLFGAVTLGTSVAPGIVAAAVGLVAIGATGIALFATANSLVQGATRRDMQGRVMGLYSVVFAGSSAIGGPIVGVLVDATSARLALAIGGVAAILVGIVSQARLRSQTPSGQVVREALGAEALGYEAE